MNVILIAVIVFGTIALWGASLFWLSKKLPKQEDETARNQFLILQQQMQSQMQLQIQQLKEEVSKNLLDTSKQNNDHLAAFSQQLNERMKETSQTLQNTQSTVGERLDNAAKVVGQLQNKLGGLEESSKRILELGQGLNDLRDILKNPKLRGNMGEFFLEDLLRQILPPEHYKIQYAFRSGEVVDAIVNLGDAMVCIDSKFPLETFVRLIQIPEDEQDRKKKEKKAFVAAIKKHAESIAKKYILPDEKTFDFAFMYIPAENIYYETIIRDDLMDDDGSLYAYLLQKRVIPVSPNSLYAYLQVIVLGLKGLKIQESAKQIMQDLTRLEGDLGKFRDDYNVLGKHLKNASGSYEEGNKRIDKFQQRYSMLTENNKTLKIADESVVPGANL